MKKFMLFFLSIVMIFSFCACDKESNDNTNKIKANEKNTISYKKSTSISLENAELIAKKKVVNLCCQKSNVSKISIDYGTFTYAKKDDGYEFNVKGTYLPKDDHGMYGSRQKFTIILTVDGDGDVKVNKDSFSKAY